MHQGPAALGVERCLRASGLITIIMIISSIMNGIVVAVFKLL